MAALRLSSNCQQITLHERVGKLLDSFEWSDCSFLVGEKTIEAHKLILAISSPVFNAMFYGPMAEVTPIVVSDIDPEVFQLLLNFIYRDKVELDSLEDACGLLYASKKYMLPYLSEMCRKHIKNMTSIRNVISVFNSSDWLQEDDLSNFCLKLICEHADLVLNAESEHLSVTCVTKIVKQPSLNMKEINLVKFLNKWAEEECLFKQMTPSDDNKRNLLIAYGLFIHLRLFTINGEDSKQLIKTGLLHDDELKFLENILHATKVNQLFRITDDYNYLWNGTRALRSMMKLNWINCCRPVLKTAKPLVISNDSQIRKVRIMCRMTVFVNSFTIPSRQSPETVSLTNYSEYIDMTVSCGSYQIGKTYSKKVEYNSNICIDFTPPIVFDEHEWYTITFCWPKNNSEVYKYPLCYRPTVASHHPGAEFIFHDDSQSSTHSASFIEGLKFCI